MGKKVSYFANPLEKGFAFVPGIDKIQSQYIYTHYDCIVFVDFSSYDRIRSYTDGHKEYFDTATILIIDHHLGDTPSHAISLKDDTCDSNCGRLYELMQQRDRTPYITPLIATYLYMGIATDTGNFRHEKQSVRVMGQVVELLKLNADKKLITKKLFENISV
jgi:phosphoesterase RecJ-like protein